MFMKIRFIEWRDPPAPADKASALSEIDAAQAALVALDARATDVAGETKAGSERVAAQAAQTDNIQTARKAALAALTAAGEAADAAMKTHERVGTFGYQVLTEDGDRVQGLVDEQGEDLPAGAVYGYEIVDQKPAAPPWAKGVIEQASDIKP